MMVDVFQEKDLYLLMNVMMAMENHLLEVLVMYDVLLSVSVMQRN
jgi:hypothetical protein